MAKQKIAIIGVGKIAVDQHLPVIDKSKDFEVAATVSGRGVQHRNLPVFKTAAELYKAMPEVKKHLIDPVRTALRPEVPEKRWSGIERRFSGMDISASQGNGHSG